MIKALLLAGVVIACCASLSSAWGQAAVCPRIGVGELTPLDNGQEAGRRKDYAAAARFYEQHLACVEQARPGVRDHINATASTRTAQAYIAASELQNAARVADAAIAWYPDYVERLPEGADKGKQRVLLIDLYSAAAYAYGGAYPQTAEGLLIKALALAALSDPGFEALTELRRLHVAVAFNRGDMAMMIERQRVLVDHLRRGGLEVRFDLMIELATLADTLEREGRAKEARPYVDEMNAVKAGLGKV